MSNLMHTIQRSAEEDSYMQSMVKEALVEKPETANGRLLQAQHTIKALTDEMKRALRAGEPEDSPYINRLTSSIAVLINQELELQALSEKQTIAV